MLGICPPREQVGDPVGLDPSTICSHVCSQNPPWGTNSDAKTQIRKRNTRKNDIGGVVFQADSILADRRTGASTSPSGIRDSPPIEDRP